MKMKSLIGLLLGLVFLLLIFPLGSVLAGAREEYPVNLEGQLTILWGDPPLGTGRVVDPVYILTTDAAEMVALQISEVLSARSGSLLALNHQRVTVVGRWLQPRLGRPPITLQVDQIHLAGNPNTPDVDGPQPWVSILCKFSDIPAEPRNLAYFENMYGSTYPGLDHYWREQSYDLINMNGSDAVGWYTLPQPRSYYVYGGQLDWGRAAEDCTAVADADVFFPDFVGINLMFNAELDGYAWGGQWFLSRDGESKYWYVTWEPPWGYGNIAVIEHEMGHGFGLPHSSGDYGQVYDNYWDVMSDPWDSTLYDPIYGVIGQHTISYHKDILEWIDAAEKFTAPPDSLSTIWLEQLALPQTSDYRMAQVPIGGSASHFYTVETRRLVGYDAGLPGNAVIIHEVDVSRQEPAHVIDIDGNGNTGDAGAMWELGETFVDSGNQIAITVTAVLTTGYEVTIRLGTPSGPPGAFTKNSPGDGATQQPRNVTLSWGSSYNAADYQYCYDTSDDDACSTWISNGTSTTVDLSGLDAGTTYYWQVRAINGDGTTYANGSETAFWSFTTLEGPPADFEKVSPPDQATNQPSNTTLTWELSSGAESYEYCYDTIDDDACSTWISAGTGISATLSGLSEGTNYYWQVRALNAGGTTYANGEENAFWSFTTMVDPPAEFNKISPADSSSDQPVDITLTWEASSGAESYEFCYDTTDDDACGNWVSIGTNTSIALSDLAGNTTYYWQVRAVNAGGTTYANEDHLAFWSFTTASDEVSIFLPLTNR